MPIRRNPTKREVRNFLRALSVTAPDRAKADAADAAMGLDRVEREKRTTPPERAPGASESQVLNAVLGFLRHHPKVAWAHRMNTAAFEVDDRYIRCGFPGLSDLVGQLKDGRFLAVECKREIGGRVSDVQQAFLDLVANNGGVSGVARSIEDAQRIIAGTASPSTQP